MDVDLKGCPLIGFWNHSLEGDGGLPRWKSIQLWPEGDSTIHPGKSQFLRFLGNFPGKSPFFFLLVISPQYIWGEASTPVVRNSDWRFPMGHPWGIHGDDHPWRLDDWMMPIGGTLTGNFMKLLHFPGAGMLLYPLDQVGPQTWRMWLSSLFVACLIVSKPPFWNRMLSYYPLVN